MENKSEIMTIEDIRSLVYIIRGQQVMLDFDLAEIYGYEVKRLNEQVKRNINRFPEDFMFQLSRDEIELVKSQIATSPDNNLKSQFATSSWGGKRKLPTEKVFHCGASGKDAGKKLCAINEIVKREMVYENIESLLLAPDKVI